MSTSKSDQLVETALGLFRAHGVHAVGIDRVLAEAGVAKATLYKHFRSKDDLVLAALRRLDETGRRDLARAVASAAGDPAGRFVATADVIATVADHGCTFCLAAQEFPDPDHPVHAAAREHKRLVRVWLAELAAAADAVDPVDVASRAQLVLDGLYAAAALGPEDGARARAAARRSLELLLDEARDRAGVTGPPRA
ncbi:MAG: helix-turn-helix domain-containing protein [Planctomycetota bacterium]